MLVRKLSIIVLTVGAMLPSAAHPADPSKPDPVISAAEKTFERALLEAERTRIEERIAAQTAFLVAIEEAKAAAQESGDLDRVRSLSERQKSIDRELEAERTSLQRKNHELAQNAVIVTRGDGFALKVFRNDATAYSNRSYQWRNVPEVLQGWTYAQIAGGDTPNVRIEVLEGGVAMVMAESTQLVEQGWTLRPEFDFEWYPRREPMHVFSRQVDAGNVIDVPHFGWTGTLVLIPPHTGGLSSVTAR